MYVESHESAADAWTLPTRGRHRRHVTVPRNHGHRVPGAVTHRTDLGPGEIQQLAEGGAVTSPLRTVLDCARTLPFGRGLTVADAALRARLVGDLDLRRAARAARGPGAARIRQVARWADAQAGSCLESLTRALLITARVGVPTSQYRLVDDGHRYDLHLLDTDVLIECDGAVHHRKADRFALDCQDATVAGSRHYLLLRFTWYDVTRRPRWTTDAVRGAVIRRDTEPGVSRATRR